MAGILHLVCTTFLVVLQFQTISGEQFGICVEACSLDPKDPNGFGLCEEGYVCKSNGCGHTCHLAAPDRKSERGACVFDCSTGPNELGLPDCTDGYECRSNGCGMTCQRPAPAKTARGACVIACSPFPDGLGLPVCADGHECRSNGCGQTCQPVLTSVQAVPEKSELGPAVPEMSELSPAVPEKKSERGACVISCSVDASDPLGLSLCGKGYQCTPNGCGRTCQRVAAVPEKKAVFGSCIEACSPTLAVLGYSDCDKGYVCKSNGCGHTCQLEKEVAKRQRCAPVLCRIYCRNGFALNEDNCEICECKE